MEGILPPKAKQVPGRWVPSPKATTQSEPQTLDTLFLNKGGSVWGICEPELQGDISCTGMKLHNIAYCLRIAQQHFRIQRGAEEVHSLLAMGVPATVPLWEQQKDSEGPQYLGHLPITSNPSRSQWGEAA